MKTIKKPLVISAAVAACFSAPVVQAQSDTFAPNVVITANRQPQLAKDVLADNVVITAEQIQQSGAVGVVDLLQQQRGIEIVRNGGVGSSASVFIRGASNAQSVVFVDGVRVGSSTFGGATWSSIPLAQIERIEIVYGPVSSIYGADAMGGVIQIFTKKAAAQSLTRISAGLGSQSLRQTEFGLSSGNRGNFQYALNFAKQSSDGFSASKPAAGTYTYNKDADGYTQKSSSAKLIWNLENQWKIGVEQAQTVTDVQFDAGPSYDDRSQMRFDNSAVYLTGKLADNWNSRLQFSRSEDSATSDASYGKSFAKTKNHGWTWQNDLTFGRDALQLVVEDREEDVWTNNKQVDGKRETKSYAAAYIVKWDAHLFNLSERLDDSSQYGRRRTGGLAYGYKWTDQLRVNVSHGTSFRAPTFNELYYPGYGISTNKPETGKNTEFGFYYDDNQWQLSAVNYRNVVSNLIVYTNQCPATHAYGCAKNVNKAILSGWTLGASTRFDQLSLRASLDFQDPRDETTGKSLARRAKKHAKLGADYRYQDWTFGVESVLSGARFDDTANAKRLGGYGVVNLRASYQISAGWSALARWNNIANKDYELARNYRTPGSNVFVGLNYLTK